MLLKFKNALLILELKEENILEKEVKMHVNYSNPLSHKLLTHEQEVSLAQKIEKGDKSARDMMIQSNLRLAFSIAKKYFNKDLQIEVPKIRRKKLKFRRNIRRIKIMLNLNTIQRRP